MFLFIHVSRTYHDPTLSHTVTQNHSQYTVRHIDKHRLMCIQLRKGRQDGYAYSYVRDNGQTFSHAGSHKQEDTHSHRRDKFARTRVRTSTHTHTHTHTQDKLSFNTCEPHTYTDGLKVTRTHTHTHKVGMQSGSQADRNIQSGRHTQTARRRQPAVDNHVTNTIRLVDTKRQASSNTR